MPQFKTVKEVKQALKNNCFRVYIASEDISKKDNIRVIDVKSTKGELIVKTFSGWIKTEFSQLVFG